MSESIVESSEETVDDFDRDADDVSNEECDLNSDTTNDSNANVVIDFMRFKDWENVSLDSIPKRKTKSDVWNFFGILKKGNTVFEPMSKKYFCKPCFDDHKFKR